MAGARPGLQQPQDAKSLLEAQASLAERQLDQIKQRLSALDGQEPAARG